MKNFNHCKLAILYITCLSLIIAVIIAIACISNLFSNTTVSLMLIIVFIMIIFDACFFFFPLCFKKNKYPYINYQWQSLEIKSWFKKPFIWYFIIPSLINYLLIIILLILVYIYPITLLNWQQLLILLFFAILLNLIK